MIQIVFIDNGVRVAGIDYPNNHLVFGIERTNIIEIFSDGKKVISTPYTEFINELGEPFLTPQSVISALELSYLDLISQEELDAEIEARITADIAINNDLTILKNNEYKILYFTTISTATGTITKPANSTIILDQFYSGGDAIVETLVNGQPSGQSPLTISGSVVSVSSFDVNGNYVLSGTPSSYPIALIYLFKIKAINYSSVNLDYEIKMENNSLIPYNGAVSDVDLGNYSLNAKSFHAKGTAGAGHFGLKHQSAGITASASESSIGANNLGKPVWKNDGNAIETILTTNDFGTTAGTVLEGDRITQTITNGVTDKAPSEDAVFDALGLKLTSANNLSDLANPLTARNNLKIWSLFLTGGNQSTTSDVSSNITDLVSPTLTASKRYRIHGVIKVGCNNTGGLRFQITLPSGASMDISLSGSNTSNTAYINATITSSSTLSAQVQTFNGASILRVDGEISLSSTAGTIQFGFASGINTQTSTVYQLGTHLTVTQIN